jgi:hypothetical protein
MINYIDLNFMLVVLNFLSTIGEQVWLLEVSDLFHMGDQIAGDWSTAN